MFLIYLSNLSTFMVAPQQCDTLWIPSKYRTRIICTITKINDNKTHHVQTWLSKPIIIAKFLHYDGHDQQSHPEIYNKGGHKVIKSKKNVIPIVMEDINGNMFNKP